MTKQTKIILSGGGTLGPVVPLLAIAEIYQKTNPNAKFVWLGTKNGPERELVEKSGILFYTLTAGKWRRYFSFWNIVDILKIIWAFFSALFFLWQERPQLLISGGGFVSVPLHYAGWLLGIPTWIHQQDIKPGLANQLMAKTADKITTALRQSTVEFSAFKTEWIGNPVRDLTPGDLDKARAFFGTPAGAPVIFAFGGGTGSSRLNQLILEALPHFPNNWQVIHLTGRERPGELQHGAGRVFVNYHVFNFFTDEIKAAYALADLVVGRAGFGTITELAALSKPAILIPMSGTHQEENVRILSESEAVQPVDERHIDGLKLAQMIKDLMNNPTKRRQLGQRLHEMLPIAKEDKIISIIDKLLAR